jgi:hypothetical protein
MRCVTEVAANWQECGPVVAVGMANALLVAEDWHAENWHELWISSC